MLTLDMLVIPEHDLSATVDMVRYLDDHGFGCAWIGDSPPIRWADVYMTLALCAASTSTIMLGPGVTNPLTRHPSVTANAMATLHALSGGRGLLGIGVGDSALRALGLVPATFKTLTGYVSAVREIFAERGIRIPVYMAASGPRALTTAARVADGVILSIGTHPALVRRALDRIALAAKDAGRDPSTLDVVVLAGLAIADTWQDARRDASPSVARRAKDAHYHPDFFFPPELEHLRRDAERVAQHYDYREHMAPDSPHATLVTDPLVDAYALAGDAERCRARLAALEDVGVTRVALFPTGRDRRATMERFVCTVTLPRP